MNVTLLQRVFLVLFSDTGLFILISGALLLLWVYYLLRFSVKKKKIVVRMQWKLCSMAQEKSVSESGLKLLLTCWDLEFYIGDPDPVRG